MRHQTNLSQLWVRPVAGLSIESHKSQKLTVGRIVTTNMHVVLSGPSFHKHLGKISSRWR